jgi:crossover junction endodeoxyribonuclease RuvC
MRKRILGIDPGSRIAGFGILEFSPNGDIFHIASGALNVVSESASFYDRLHRLGLAFREVIQKYEPEAVAVENIFLGKNADSAFKLGHARGVIAYEVLLRGLPVFEYSTRAIKKTVTGSGAAEKLQVQNVLKILLKINSFTHFDASDAVAVAYHHAVAEISELRLRRGAGKSRGAEVR